MIKVKNIFILISFILLTSCGYSPMLSSEKIDFYFSEINYEGNQQINNHIDDNLRKYRNYNEGKKNYKLNIVSDYQKKVANKDKNGNPKNYNILLNVEVNYVSIDGEELKKIFRRNFSLETKKKKIDEKNIEKKKRKDLSELISEDIIFYLTSK